MTVLALVLATMGSSDWLLVAAIVLIVLLLVVIAMIVGWYLLARTRNDAEWNNELISTLKSVRRGISSIQKRLDGRDAWAQQELSEAKRLILDVESRLTGHISASEDRLRHENAETKDIVRDTRAQMVNIHGGQNNVGNNSIGGGQKQGD